MNYELLKQILLSDNVYLLLKEHESKLFAYISELKICNGFEQNNDWHVYDVYEHILNVVKNVDDDIRLRLAALFHDIGKPIVYSVDDNGVGHFYNHWVESLNIFKKFARENNLSEELYSIVSKLIYYHDINFDKLNDDVLNEILINFDEEEIRLLFKLKKADLLAQNPKYHNLLNDYEKQESKIIASIK